VHNSHKLFVRESFKEKRVAGFSPNVPSVAEVAEGDLPSAPASQARFNLPESAPPLAG